jgi:hypothetical protein
MRNAPIVVALGLRQKAPLYTRQMHKFRGSGAELPVTPAQEACRARFEKFTKCEHGRVPKNRTSTLQLQRCGAMRASRYARFGFILSLMNPW